MEPIDFPAANTTFTADDGAVGDLPANVSHGIVLTKWRASWRERLTILLFGTLWVSVLGRFLPPLLVSGNRSFEIET